MFLTILLAIVFAFAKTESRSWIYSTSIGMLAGFGYLNGFITARFLKFYGTSDFKFVTIVSSCALPVYFIGAIVFEVFFSWITRSPQRYSAMQTLLRVFVWYLVNGVMCYLGAYHGYTRYKAAPLPCELGKVRRPIPEQPYYMSIFVIAPVFGAIQFASIYAEFSYLVDSIFKNQIYAMFGFLLLNFLMLVMVIALLSCLQTYM